MVTPQLVLRPLEVDFQKIHESGEVLLEALTGGGLSPMFALANHGLETDIEELVRRVASRQLAVPTPPLTSIIAAGNPVPGASVSLSVDPTEVPACVPVELHEVIDAESAAALHARLAALVEELLAVLLGLESREELVTLLREKLNKRVGGRESVRWYPSEGAGELGAHVDLNLLTLLWASGPGLEVLDPRAPGIDPGAVRRAGQPSTCGGGEDDRALAALTDEGGGSGWALVDADWGRGVFLVTIGDEWFRTFVDPLDGAAHDAAAMFSMEQRAVVPAVACPVYHRVNRRANYQPRAFRRRDTTGDGEIQGSPPIKNGGRTDGELSYGCCWDAGRFSIPFLARLVDLE